MQRLKIGIIPFGNLFPIFHTIRNKFDCSDFEFIEGVPSHLNHLLRKGDIDLSPSSSVEYLRHKEIYDFIEGHSISSRGQVGSIFLFSKKPINELNDAVISVTSQSATSIELLRVITSNFYNINIQIQVSPTPQLNNPAFLLIGDDALRQYKLKSDGSFIYDLGEIWYENTGLPFVFALWIVRKDNIIEEKRENFKKFKNILDNAKKIAFETLDEIALLSPLSDFMTKDEILHYWSKLDYDFTDRHIEGLNYFNRLLKKEID